MADDDRPDDIEGSSEPTDDERDAIRRAIRDSLEEQPEEQSEEQPLARVRYGLGKELLLYADAFVARQNEVDDEIRIRLEHMRRLIMLPGEYTPSKLVVMIELDDGSTLIAAEGMTNVRDFRKLLAALVETRPEIELDPPNMDEQLMQALDIKRRSLLGCYGFVLGSCVLLWIIYLVVAFIGHTSVPH